MSALPNSSRRVIAGAARDHLLGIEAVTGTGQAFRGGGRVMKNVTGYDMCRAVCGSWGTLAVMSTVTFKVLPRPERTGTLVVLGLDDALGVEALSARRSRYRVLSTSKPRLPHACATAVSGWSRSRSPRCASRRLRVRCAIGSIG